MFDNAFGLAKGGDFKIAGVRAGKTEDIHIEGQAHPLAVVEAKVTEPGLADLRADARCEVRPAVVHRRVLHRLPAGHLAAPAAGRRPRPGRADHLDDRRSTWSTTSCGGPTATACA